MLTVERKIVHDSHNGSCRLATSDRKDSSFKDLEFKLLVLSVAVVQHWMGWRLRGGKKSVGINCGVAPK